MAGQQDGGGAWAARGRRSQGWQDAVISTLKPRHGAAEAFDMAARAWFGVAGAFEMAARAWCDDTQRSNLRLK